MQGSQKVYKQKLDSLMSSVHWLGPGELYDCECVYTENEKRQVTLEELMRWLNTRTFGVPKPRPQMAIRPLVRAKTVAFFKKAISFSMPDLLHGWRTGSNDGNPTKCAEVNYFVKNFRKLEARQQGPVSKTWCPMEEKGVLTFA